MGAKLGALEITPSTLPFLRSGYQSRRPEELAVLSRWFDRASLPGDVVPAAKFLDIILYSREQLIHEYESLPAADRARRGDPPAPWGIISVKAQDEPHETPMQPITAMRNALGTEHGGSGIPIDREKYDAAVEYWRNRAVVQ